MAAKVVSSFPLENRVSAVITISEFNESPEQAIQSVLENPQFFADLHLVKFGYSSHEVLYLGWEKDLEALGGLGLEPMWHAKLDGAVKTMLEDMLYYTNRDHFGVSSITFIEHDDGFKVTPRVWIEALSYGFLLVILMMDTFRSMLNLLQYHRTVDLRADLTITTYPNRTRVARDRWWIWWLFTGISPSRRGGAACMQVPSQKDQGFKFVLRTVKMHSGMGLGLWIFGFLLYWFAFSWPLANDVVSPNKNMSKAVVAGEGTKKRRRTVTPEEVPPGIGSQCLSFIANFVADSVELRLGKELEDARRVATLCEERWGPFLRCGYCKKKAASTWQCCKCGSRTCRHEQECIHRTILCGECEDVYCLYCYGDLDDDKCSLCQEKASDGERVVIHRQVFTPDFRFK